MIIGPDFIWLHFPKCAGLATEKAILELVPDARKRMPRHLSIPQLLEKEPTFELAGRKILCGFRRLPNWLLSRVHYGSQLYPHHVVSRDMLLAGDFYMPDGTVRRADFNAERFGSWAVDHWIRMELIAADLGRALGLDRDIVSRHLDEVNVTAPYAKDVSNWFSPDEIAALYLSNPIWADIERRVYGSLLMDETPLAVTPTQASP